MEQRLAEKLTPASGSVVAEYQVGQPVSALTISSDHAFVMAGWSDVLKVIGVSSEGLTELKSIKVISKGNVKASITDVSWCPVPGSSLVAAALNNGGVGTWDLAQSRRASWGGAELPQWQTQPSDHVIVDHARTVTRVSWHPNDPSLLLSCSLDNSVKLWDRRGRGIHCSMTFQPKSEAIRDVQFSPFHNDRFASVFDNGQLQVWDRRQPSQPELKLMAHSQPTLTLDWHPTREWVIATGSKDRMVRVWDLTHASRGDSRAKNATPNYSLHCIAPVARVSWRPGHANHIAACGSDADVYVYHISQPFVPIAVVEGTTLESCAAFRWCDAPAPSTGSNSPVGLSHGAQGGKTLREVGSVSIAGPENEGSGEDTGSSGWRWNLSMAMRGGGNTPLPQVKRSLLGAWQHMITAGKDGAVKLHSLARSFKPRLDISPSSFALAPTGGLSCIHDTVDWTLEAQGLWSNDFLDPALGVFREYPRRTVPTSPARSKGGRTPVTTSMKPFSPQSASGVASPDRLESATLIPDANSVSFIDNSRGGAGKMSVTSPSLFPKPISFQQHGTTGANSKRQPSDADLAGGGMEATLDLDGDYSNEPPRPRGALLTWALKAATDTGQDLHVIESMLHVEDVTGYEPDVVRALASRYSLCNGAVHELCAKNAAAAFDCGLVTMAHVWRMIQVLLDGASPQEQPMQNATNFSQQRNQHQQSGVSLGADEIEYTMPQALALLEDTAAEEKGTEGVKLTMNGQTQHDEMEGQTLNVEDGSWSNGRGRGAPISWLWAVTISDFLKDCAEQGDVQHCVAVCEVVHSWWLAQGLPVIPLSDKDPFPTQGTIGQEQEVSHNHDHEEGQWCGLDIPASLVREWYLSYLDLLYRLELWQAAAELTRRSDDAFIRSVNQSGTVVHPSCAFCRTASGPSSRCGKCSRSLSRCGLCEQPVRGLYAWCPGCSHGGHLTHMLDWYSRKKFCPTGCGHKCIT